VSISEYTTYRFDIYQSGTRADYWANGILAWQGKTITFGSYPYVELYISAWDAPNNPKLHIPWVLVRAYSATPPAALTFSGEVESDAPQPFPGLTAYPRDLTGNGLYTDINGNNRLDYNDLTVFFQNLAWAKTAQPTSCFDFNGNGWLDYNDVITLFSIIMEEHT
jgi:PKD repeat protein